MPKLSILLSTINERIFQTKSILESGFSDTEYIIVHQITDNKDKTEYKSFYDTYFSPAYKFIQLYEKGTGVSRNCALHHATGETFFICDDDITFLPDFYETLILSAAKYPSADILTFMIKTPEGTPYKKYFKEKRWHNIHTTAKVSNVEMLIRKTFYEKNPIQFDTRFGLGTIFNTGEEFAFLADALKRKAKILFIPEFIVLHPQQSSGSNFSPDLIQAKGAIIARVYRWKFILINFIFALRKYKSYKSKISFFNFVKNIYKGSFEFYKYE